MQEGIALHASLFYDWLMTYRPEDRPDLLQRQKKLARSSALRSWVFNRLNGFIDRRMAVDVEKVFAAPEFQADPELVRLH